MWLRRSTPTICPYPIPGGGLESQHPEQNYEYDLLNPQKLLRKVVASDSPAGNPESRDKKRRNRGRHPPFDAGGEISFRSETRSPSGTGANSSFANAQKISFLSLPSSGCSENKPFPRPQKVEASYLTSGMNWKADYVACSGSIRYSDGYHGLGNPR